VRQSFKQLVSSNCNRKEGRVVELRFDHKKKIVVIIVVQTPKQTVEFRQQNSPRHTHNDLKYMLSLSLDA
jgi:hypothetical protein